MILFLFIFCFFVSLSAMEQYSDPNLQGSNSIENMGSVLYPNNQNFNQNYQQYKDQSQNPYQHQYQECQNCQMIGNSFNQVTQYQADTNQKFFQVTNQVKSMEEKIECLEKSISKQQEDLKSLRDEAKINLEDVKKEAEAIVALQDKIKEQKPCKRFSSFCKRIYTYLSKDEFKNSENLARRTIILAIPFVLIPLFMRSWEGMYTENIYNICNALLKIDKKEEGRERLIRQASLDIDDTITGCRLGTLILSGFSFFLGFHWW